MSILDLYMKRKAATYTQAQFEDLSLQALQNDDDELIAVLGDHLGEDQFSGRLAPNIHKMVISYLLFNPEKRFENQITWEGGTSYNLDSGRVLVTPAVVMGAETQYNNPDAYVGATIVESQEEARNIIAKNSIAKNDLVNKIARRLEEIDYSINPMTREEVNAARIIGNEGLYQELERNNADIVFFTDNYMDRYDLEAIEATRETRRALAEQLLAEVTAFMGN